MLPRATVALAGFAGVAGLALGASGCAVSSGYQYIQNDDLGIYAKLPKDWTVYDEADLFPDDTDREREQRAQQLWVRAFDSSDQPSVADAQAFGDEPVGQVIAQAIPASDREVFDLRTLRGGGDPSRDPVLAASQDLDGLSVAVFADDPVQFDGGFSGVHTVFAVRSDDDGEVVVTDRTAVRNADTTVMVVFEVRCTEECYAETYQHEIDDLVKSWTIQEVT